jgi:DNA-binding CsgD family transcriptional regulator
MQHRLSAGVRETDLGLIWQLLCRGGLFLSESHCVRGRCFAVLEARAESTLVRSEHLDLLRRVFQGESQKALALEEGLSVATIAGYCKVALSAVTEHQRVSRAPIVLVMAALASRGDGVGFARLESELDERRYVVSVDVPGQTFRDRLTACEWQVARLSIEGEAHAGIAQQRGTSERTVANQLASVFAKLKVSGRSELRAKAVREYAERPRTPNVVAVPAPRLQLLSPPNRHEHALSMGSLA